MTAQPTETEVLDLARSRILQSKDLEACGVSRTRLSLMVAAGTLERLGRGMYVAPDFDHAENLSLAEVAIRCPRGVIGLLTALRFQLRPEHV